MTVHWRVLAIRAGLRRGTRGEHFLEPGAWDEPHETAYWFWAARRGARTVLIDAGMSTERAAGLAGLDWAGPAHELLAAAGIAPESVDRVILSHLHYDHAGGARYFPHARVAIQRAERAYWSGPVAERVVSQRWLVDPRDLRELEEAAAQGRLEELDGSVELEPGIRVDRLGGHTPGMQAVTVATESGPVVIASDASHFFENVEGDKPGRLFLDLPAVYFAFDTLAALDTTGNGIAPGHDPDLSRRHRVVSTAPHTVRITP
ncbi:N-acyl homoserine lactonase family protein [Gryllotalpicola koreensis]|uniref:N-acyl homoserine lactonase family protein n=1 Tax=Gryllotalpicola koreensis TaxID=993086 RepID=A0ABP8A2M3_9MICO